MDFGEGLSGARWAISVAYLARVELDATVVNPAGAGDVGAGNLDFFALTTLNDHKDLTFSPYCLPWKEHGSCQLGLSDGFARKFLVPLGLWNCGLNGQTAKRANRAEESAGRIDE
jgi:hypothetical protein